MKISADISLFEEFADGFKLHKEILYRQDSQNEKLTSFNLCDIAEYIRTQEYD